MHPRVDPPPPNSREFAVPTEPDIRESAFVRMLLAQNRAEDGLLQLGASMARHLHGYLRGRADLTPEDRELERELRAFTDGWAKVERRSWRALTFHQARERKPSPVRTKERRREPQARQGRPSRRVRTSATSRGSPSSQSDDDPPPERDLDALRGFGAATERMYVHVGRRLAAARAA